MAEDQTKRFFASLVFSSRACWKSSSLLKWVTMVWLFAVIPPPIKAQLNRCADHVIPCGFDAARSPCCCEVATCTCSGAEAMAERHGERACTLVRSSFLSLVPRKPDCKESLFGSLSDGAVFFSCPRKSLHFVLCSDHKNLAIKVCVDAGGSSLIQIQTNQNHG